MKRKFSPIKQRLVINLDMDVVFEALILKRWTRMANTRREDWLRGLLVLGFQSECRALRELQGDGRSAQHAPPRVQHNGVRSPISTAPPQPSPLPQVMTARAKEHAAPDTAPSGGRVSLAALRDVIG